MRERVNVFARIKGRNKWIALGVITKDPNEKINLETVVETYFAQGKPYGFVARKFRKYNPM
jgi:hypothetical protein